jgi:hypothetical protein
MWGVVVTMKTVNAEIQTASAPCPHSVPYLTAPDNGLRNCLHTY